MTKSQLLVGLKLIRLDNNYITHVEVIDVSKSAYSHMLFVNARTVMPPKSTAKSSGMSIKVKRQVISVVNVFGCKIVSINPPETPKLA